MSNLPKSDLTYEERSINDAKAQHPELKGKGWSPEQECLGRYLGGRQGALGCDWCAYGLFSGPLFVLRGDERVACFDFAGQPFTKAAA